MTAAWTNLLKDTQTRAPEQTSRFANEFLKSVGEEDEYDRRHDQLTRLFGETAARLYRARAYDRLEGKVEAELTHLPSAELVPPARKADIARLMAQPGHFPQSYEKLSMNEQLSLPEILDTHTELRKGLRPFANRIAEVHLSEKVDPVLLEKLKKMQGTSLSTETVKNLHALCKAEVIEGRFPEVTITRRPLLKGVFIEFKSPAELTRDQRWGQPNQSKLVMWVYPFRRKQKFADWPVELKGKRNGDADSENPFAAKEELQRSEIWKSVDDFSEETEHLASPQQITIRGKSR
ncbi:MAG: hypothetical protein WD708_00445 [Kiritimatiellia bacterium]